MTASLDTGVLQGALDESDVHPMDSVSLVFHWLKGRWGKIRTSSCVELFGGDPGLSLTDAAGIILMKVSGAKTVLSFDQRSLGGRDFEVWGRGTVRALPTMRGGRWKPWGNRKTKGPSPVWTTGSRELRLVVGVPSNRRRAASGLRQERRRVAPRANDA